MNNRTMLEFFGLAMIWGVVFLFMRVGAPEFGPIALIEIRVLLAAAVLTPLVLKKQVRGIFIAEWRPILVIGLTNYAIPFCLLAYATLRLSSGFTSILNATLPFTAALIGYWFWNERLTWTRVLGLVIGFIGVSIMIWGRENLVFTGDGISILACLLATTSYGYAANYSRSRAKHLPPLVLTAGSLWAAAVMLAPLALVYWPQTQPSAIAWSAAVALALLSTAYAFVLYYRLIATIGAGRTVLVTFLIPIFASFWGVVLLHESIDTPMLVGGATILLGVALATGAIGQSLVFPKLSFMTKAQPKK